MSDSMDLILLSPAQQQWLDRWGRWLDRATALDAEHEHEGYFYTISKQTNIWNWYMWAFDDEESSVDAGAITVHSRAAAEALAAEMNAESATVQEVNP